MLFGLDYQGIFCYLNMHNFNNIVPPIPVVVSVFEIWTLMFFLTPGHHAKLNTTCEKAMH